LGRALASETVNFFESEGLGMDVMRVETSSLSWLGKRGSRIEVSNVEAGFLGSVNWKVLSFVSFLGSLVKG